MNNLNSVLLEGRVVRLYRVSDGILWRRFMIETAGKEDFFFTFVTLPDRLREVCRSLDVGHNVRVIGRLDHAKEGFTNIIAEHIELRYVYDQASEKEIMEAASGNQT